jgi:hypothetical protein
MRCWMLAGLMLGPSLWGYLFFRADVEEYLNRLEAIAEAECWPATPMLSFEVRLQNE